MVWRQTPTFFNCPIGSSENIGNSQRPSTGFIRYLEPCLTTTAKRWTWIVRGRFLTGGILSCNPVLEAAHHDCTGHTRHRGDRNEQTVAPSSMIAWLTARGSAERTNFSAAVQSSPGFSSIQPCILETTLRTL